MTLDQLSPDEAEFLRQYQVSSHEQKTILRGLTLRARNDDPSFEKRANAFIGEARSSTRIPGIKPIEKAKT